MGLTQLVRCAQKTDITTGVIVGEIVKTIILTFLFIVIFPVGIALCITQGDQERIIFSWYFLRARLLETQQKTSFQPPPTPESAPVITPMSVTAQELPALQKGGQSAAPILQNSVKSKEQPVTDADPSSKKPSSKKESRSIVPKIPAKKVEQKATGESPVAELKKSVKDVIAAKADGSESLTRSLAKEKNVIDGSEANSTIEKTPIESKGAAGSTVDLAATQASEIVKVVPDSTEKESANEAATQSPSSPVNAKGSEQEKSVVSPNAEFRKNILNANDGIRACVGDHNAYRQRITEKRKTKVETTMAGVNASLQLRFDAIQRACAGDGSCMYHALSYGLFGDVNRHIELRSVLFTFQMTKFLPEYVKMTKEQQNEVVSSLRAAQGLVELARGLVRLANSSRDKRFTILAPVAKVQTSKTSTTTPSVQLSEDFRKFIATQRTSADFEKNFWVKLDEEIRRLPGLANMNADALPYGWIASTSSRLVMAVNGMVEMMGHNWGSTNALATAAHCFNCPIAFFGQGIYGKNSSGSFSLFLPRDNEPDGVVEVTAECDRPRIIRKGSKYYLDFAFPQGVDPTTGRSSPITYDQWKSIWKELSKNFSIFFSSFPPSRVPLHIKPSELQKTQPNDGDAANAPEEPVDWQDAGNAVKNAAEKAIEEYKRIWERMTYLCLFAMNPPILRNLGNVHWEAADFFPNFP
ncbi:MAG: hypothetical protein LBP65_02705 [Puniceicoccales bacterium]|nr:hypothetical protein [Puniceicoccales bacterium]